MLLPFTHSFPVKKGNYILITMPVITPLLLNYYWYRWEHPASWILYVCIHTSLECDFGRAVLFTSPWIFSFCMLVTPEWLILESSHIWQNLKILQLNKWGDVLANVPTRRSNMWSGILYVKWKHVESLQVVSAQKLKERLCFPGLCWFNIPHGEGEVPVAGGRLQSSARSTQIPGRHRNDPRYGKFHWLLYITLNYWSGAI